MLSEVQHLGSSPWQLDPEAISDFSLHSDDISETIAAVDGAAR
jgi:hypothetical protein